MGADNAEASPSSCPVDHTARAAWLKNSASSASPRSTEQNSCSSSDLAQGLSSKLPSLKAPPGLKTSHLATEREVSSIPRAGISKPTSSALANNEQESGASASGKWIYPSEEMFFNAMRRKNFDPRAEDMRSIVPIHNAVNERAWKEIREWERGRGSEKCGGPRLHSFSGDAHAMTPKARLNTLLGYTAPFDRHDWVVDRCGTRVEYVIDFYAGKKDGSGKNISFYLDVRPKLNSWEGWRMRAAKLVGFS